MRRNGVGSLHDVKTRQRVGIGLDAGEVQVGGNRNCEKNPTWPKARPSSPIDLRLWLSPEFFCGLDFRFPDSPENGIHEAG
jgi:hypothetical protein